MNTSGNEVSGRDIIHTRWENTQPETDAVFCLRSYTQFSDLSFDDKITGLTRGAFFLDHEEDKIISPTTTPVYERGTGTVALLSSCGFRTTR